MKRKAYERNRRIVGQIKEERSDTMSTMSEIHNLSMSGKRKELVKHLQGTKMRKFAEFAADRFLEAAQQIKDKEKNNDGSNNKTSR